MGKKAMQPVAGPSKYEMATSCGAVKDAKDACLDKHTGGIAKTRRPSFNFEKPAGDKGYDGNYVRVASELDKKLSGYH